MAEQLGSGLQNRVHRCESGSRLVSMSGQVPAKGLNGTRAETLTGGGPRLAGVAELADARDLKSRDLRVVRVQLPSPARVEKDE